MTVSIVGLVATIPAEPASSAVLDETGGFEVVVPGVTAATAPSSGSRQRQQSEPALLTVQSSTSSRRETT